MRQPASAHTSLDPQETKYTKPEPRCSGIGNPSTDPGTAWRHSGWSPTRQRITAAFARVGLPANRQESFRTCGSHAWVYHDTENPDHLRVFANCCHDRWCQPCQRARAHAIKANLAKLADAKRLRLVTFTLRAQLRPLKDTLRHLLTSWRRLKASRWWKERTTGGAVVLEVTYNYTRRTWHPHLHVLHEGNFLPHHELRDRWSRITHGSFIVDVRPVRNVEHGLRYIAKYVTKPVPTSLTHHPDLLDQAIIDMHGTRVINTFGRWRGTKLTEIHDDTLWVPIDSLAHLLERSLSGDPDAKHLLRLLERTEPCPTGTNAARSPPTNKPSGERPSLWTASPAA